ncbi:MAG: translation initiation factor IF-2 [Candidatus Altiarchaeota archaeon]|nr:translation initiation factor IF-2 [Candidatus Altiarchaeota archaeon]
MCSKIYKLRKSLFYMRQPIVVVLGHVDHGKTQMLDFIRRTQVQRKEAGGITQHIGATEVPASYIKKFCKPMLDKLKIDVTIPGLLFVDTPGHAAFSNLRKRGGSVADLAILVVDIMSGIQPQTLESIEILKQFKVPFIVGANKVDLLPDYVSKNGSFLSNLKNQKQSALTNLEIKLYEITGKLAELGFEAERIDRVTDFTNQVVVVPASGKTGEGLIDVLALITGLAQKFLVKRLEVTNKMKGNILEIKQEKGLGATADAIIYDGELSEGQTIVISGVDEPIVTKCRCLLKPEPMKESRTEKKFIRVKTVKAASGVKIHGPGMDKAVAGSSIIVACPETLADAIEEIKNEMDEIEFSTDKVGVVVKTDTLGTLEALVKMLQERGIPVRKAKIGDISKSDIVEAEEVKQSKPSYGAVLGFNVKNTTEKLAASKEIKVITGDIVYKILESYEEWVEEEREKLREKELSKLPRPVKFKIVPGYIFRNNDPAIVGIEVTGGLLKNHIEVMKEDGKIVGKIKQLEIQGESVKESKTGGKMAASIDGPTVGRQIKEGDTLITSMSEPEYRKLKKFLDMLSDDEKAVLDEITAIKRKEKKTWGMLDM